jgi:hypothetical protein
MKSGKEMHAISSQESQNTRSLVTGQAFFRYSIDTIKYGLLARQQLHSVQFIIFSTHPPVRFARAKSTRSVGLQARLVRFENLLKRGLIGWYVGLAVW